MVVRVTLIFEVVSIVFMISVACMISIIRVKVTSTFGVILAVMELGVLGEISVTVRYQLFS